MAAKFKEELPAKYEEIKNRTFENMPEKISSKAIEEVFNEYLSGEENQLSPEAKKKLGHFFLKKSPLYI